MTTGAVCAVFAGCELSRVRVLVTTEAFLRSCAEIDVFQIGLKRWRAMAVGTGPSAMRTDEGKFCFRMVKAVQLFPLSRCVAGLATCNRSIPALRCHLLAELPFVRIHVANRARAIVESVFYRRC